MDSPRAQETVTSKLDWVSRCDQADRSKVMLLPLFRLRSSSHILVRLIPLRKQIECWRKLYDPAQSLTRTHCGANRVIVTRHASCTLSGIASRNFPPIDLTSGWVNFQSATLGQFCIGGNSIAAAAPMTLAILTNCATR